MGYRENEPLSASQRAALDKVRGDGHLTGVTSVYWHLISVMGHVDAPTKKHVAGYMRKVPDVQASRFANGEGSRWQEKQRWSHHPKRYCFVLCCS